LAIPFTYQELKRAWRQLSSICKPVAGNTRTNQHRLLLFYAAECGLKAVWLKRRQKSFFDDIDIQATGHDLGKILSALRVGSQVSIPINIQMSPVVIQGKKQIPRNGGIEILHQVWRYGGQCLHPTDMACEQQLEQVLDWIKGELQ